MKIRRLPIIEIEHELEGGYDAIMFLKERYGHDNVEVKAGRIRIVDTSDAEGDVTQFEDVILEAERFGKERLRDFGARMDVAGKQGRLVRQALIKKGIVEEDIGIVYEVLEVGLTDVAVAGELIVEVGKFRSPVITDPTWLELAIIANEAVLVNDYDCRRAFTEITASGDLDENGIPIYCIPLDDYYCYRK